MFLFLGKNVDEFPEISNTSVHDELKQLIVAIIWLYNLDKVFFLWPRDTSNSSKLSDECTVGLNKIQQLNTVDSQRSYLSFV